MHKLRTVGGVLALALAFSNQAAADGAAFFSRSGLSPDQEVEEVTDEATGEPIFVPAELSGYPQGSAVATISFDRDFERARVRVRFRNLTSDLTRLHLHCNIAGKNGPVAIGLIDLLNPANDNSQDISQNGNVVSGTLRNDNFPGGDRCSGPVGRPVNNIVSLAAAIDAGLIYWNLHTEDNPPGELRGQVRPLDDDD